MGLLTIRVAHTDAASVLYFQALTLELLMDTMNFLHDENTKFWNNLAPINASFVVLVVFMLPGRR